MYLWPYIITSIFTTSALIFSKLEFDILYGERMPVTLILSFVVVFLVIYWFQCFSEYTLISTVVTIEE